MALLYKNVIDITSKSDSLTLIIFLKPISYFRELSNAIHIFLASGGLHRVL